jgi:hypothetical protein
VLDLTHLLITSLSEVAAEVRHMLVTVVLAARAARLDTDRLLSELVLTMRQSDKAVQV